MNIIDIFCPCCDSQYGYVEVTGDELSFELNTIQCNLCYSRFMLVGYRYKEIKKLGEYYGNTVL